MIVFILLMLGVILFFNGVGGFLINVLILGGLELLGIMFSGVLGFIILGISIKYIILARR